MRVIAFIEDGEVSKRILQHVGLPAQLPEACPARAPPTPLPGSNAELVFDGFEHCHEDPEPGIDSVSVASDPEPDPDYPDPD
jgi:hypothetical protein